nr:putative tyrosine-protein kinase Wsck [Onthophagus taurus]
MSASILILFCLLFQLGDFSQKEFLGCYEDNYTIKLKISTEIYSEQDCVENCYKEYYPYALFRVLNNCACSHFIGEIKNETHCEEFCPNCEIKNQIRNVYFTGFKVLGPPTNLMISNVTESQLHISWNPPDAAKALYSYTVSAKVIQTYASVPPRDLSWNFSNDTFNNDLSSLHPATHYNVSVWAKNHQGPGIAAYQIVETKIGFPSHNPETPEILFREKNFMKIKIKPVRNDNGPISSYLIIVSNRSSLQTVDTRYLMTVTQALNSSLTYYVTAEFLPEQLNETFMIGDGNVYGEYYNAPLSPSTSYDILLGIKSKKDEVETSAFSSLSVETKYIGDEDRGFISNELLIVLIFLVCLALVIALIIFVVIKRRLVNDYRRHSNEIQELRVRSQVINVENHGYVAEEHPDYVNHYEELRKQVWMIPHQSLKIDYTKILGQGKFGYVYKATLEKDMRYRDVVVYSIADKTLTQKEKAEMLKNLGILIRVGEHKNILHFIGTCENLDSISVTMEYNELTLKEFLLMSRVRRDQSYTNLEESVALNICHSITKGLHFLHAQNIIHKQLCARHIVMINRTIPKISGFGLATYYKDGRTVNCTRWTAREVLNGDKYSVKSDIWSMACLIWEICSLGATPYGSLTNTEVAEKVLRGHTLPRLGCMDTEFYQTLLNCWQLSSDERPYVNALEESIEQFLGDPTVFLAFSLCSDGSHVYELFNFELELNPPMM